MEIQLHHLASVFPFPTGQFFGRKTQKGPNKNISNRTNLRPNFLRKGRKGAKFFKCLDSFIFSIRKYLCRWFRFAQLAKGKKSRP
jgi:hypothetical protein